MTTALVPKEQTQPATGFDRFIEMAITQPNFSVDALERLLKMQKDIMATNAKAAYDEALAAFQSECPIIHKDKKVDFTSKRTGNRTSYSYAPLDSIVAQVKDALKRHGFSYSMQSEITNDSWVLATCKLTHTQGHSETSSFKVPIDKEAFMNAQQQVAAALTYAKRYAFCGVTGILTGDQDDDAHGADNEKPKTTPQQEQPKAPASAPSEPQQQENGPLTSKGFISNITPLACKKAKPTDPDKFRYKIELNDHAKPFYTFDKKIKEYLDKHAMNSEVTITFEVSKYGQDIKTASFDDPNADFAKFCEETK